MNKKKVVALLAAATMLLSTVPVFAAGTGSGSATETEVTGGSLTITGTGTVNDVSKVKPLKVTLPTGNAVNFTVDPHNLINLASGASVEMANNVTGEGAILAGENSLAVIKNMSNVGVKVGVTINLNNAANSSAPINLVTEQAAVVSGDAANMFLVAVPSTQETWNDATYVTTGQAIAVDSDGTTFSYVLNEAVYEIVNKNGSFSYEYDTDTENNFDAAAFKMGGVVNRAADWSPYVDKLEVQVVFNVAEAADADVRIENSPIYALASGSAATTAYAPVVKEEAKAIECHVDYNKNSNWFWLAKDASTPFTVGATISNATVNGEAATATIDAAGYVLFKWDDMKEDHPAAPWTFTVTVDGVKYTATYNN